MSDKRKPRSSLLEAIHETAKDLYEGGSIDKRRMAHFDALCLQPVPEFGAEQIRALREKYRLSQAVLASVLNTSLSTVRQWEIGAKHPSGPSRKLLDLLERKGLEGVT
ncbi:MAG: DNA-binding transcriptional regulator [Magnetococcales bacterium]|nr:DNA-binding transcriptional regulator [Magnetococcales bacterium]